MRAPFPYAGGKSTVADVVWSQFGDVDHYIEPFAGGLGVLLNRPSSHTAKSETVNDIDALITNAWRGIQMHPSVVATMCESWPVSELDMQARNRQMIEVKRSGDLEKALRDDPNFCDVELAAWWIWGVSAWCGGAWGDVNSDRRPNLSSPGKGVHAICRRGNLPDLFDRLSDRMRHVRICCGDWRRVVTDGAGGSLSISGTTGVFLDPPYEIERRRDGLYAEEMDCADEVRKWAIEHSSSDVRIALCGLEGEHDMPDSWLAYSWTTTGFGSDEMIWFSPSCLGGVEQKNLL